MKLGEVAAWRRLDIHVSAGDFHHHDDGQRYREATLMVDAEPVASEMLNADNTTMAEATQYLMRRWLGIEETIDE